MAITRTPMVDDDGTGTTGTVINNAWKQQFYDQIDAADAAAAFTGGIWTPVPYTAGDFYGVSAMVWTVEAADLVHFSYAVVNKIAFVQFEMTNTSITGTVAPILYIKLPINAVPGTRFYPYWYQAAGVGAFGVLAVVTNVLQLWKDATTTGNWVLGTNNLRITGAVVYPIP